MAQRSNWQSVCRGIDAASSLTLLLLVNSLFSLAAGMSNYRVAVQGLGAKRWIAILFLSGILFFTICFAGSMIRAFVHRHDREERSTSPKLGFGTGLLWGCAIALPVAVAGAITPPSQELFLAGAVILCIAIPALFGVIFTSRVLGGERY